MNPPFDKEEVEKAAAKPENKKSFGKDGIYVELLKYTPEKSSQKNFKYAEQHGMHRGIPNRNKV